MPACIGAGVQVRQPHWHGHQDLQLTQQTSVPCQLNVHTFSGLAPRPTGKHRAFPHCCRPILNPILLLSPPTSRIALQRGFLKAQGKTPEATMASALYTDVKKRNGTSIFTRCGGSAAACVCMLLHAVRHSAIRNPDICVKTVNADPPQWFLSLPSSLLSAVVATHTDTSSELPQSRPCPQNFNCMPFSDHMQSVHRATHGPANIQKSTAHHTDTLPQVQPNDAPFHKLDLNAPYSQCVAPPTALCM